MAVRYNQSPLKFICPVTDRQVDTGVDLDEDSFAKLDDGTELGCPACADAHRLDNVQSWLGDATLLSSSIDLRRFAFGRLYLHLWRSLLDLGLH